MDNPEVVRLFERLNGVIERVDIWVWGQARWKEVLEGATEALLGIKPGASLRLLENPEHVIEFQLLHEYVTLDLSLPPENRPAVNLFLESHRAGLNQEDIEALESWCQQRVSAFEVIERGSGGRLLVKDLIAETERTILPQRVTLEPGALFMARIFPYRGLCYFSNAVGQYPSEGRYTFLRAIRHFHEALKTNRLTAKELLWFVKGSPEGSGSVERVELELVRLLAQWEVQSYTLPDIHRAIQKGLAKKINPIQLVDEVYRRARRPDQKDLQHFVSLIQRLWNDAADRNGTPLEDQRGPLEHELIGDLITFSQQKIDVNDPAQTSRESFNLLAERWLDAPQEELEGRTPREVIFKERRQRGDPRTELGISLEVNKMDGSVGPYSEAVTHMGKGRFALAVRDFRAALPLMGSHPERFRLLDALGVAYAMLGMKLHAEECLVQALEINPSDKIAKDHLQRLRKATPDELAAEGINLELSLRPETNVDLLLQERFRSAGLEGFSTSLPNRIFAEALGKELTAKLGDKLPSPGKALKVLKWFAGHPAWTLHPPSPLWIALKRVGFPSSVEDQIRSCLEALRHASKLQDLSAWVERLEALTGGSDFSMYRAEALMRTGQHGAGLQLFMGLAAQRPGDAWVFWHWGWAWLEIGTPRPEEAREAFQKMRERAEKYPVPFLRRHAIRAALDGILEAASKASDPALLKRTGQELHETLYRLEEEEVAERIALDERESSDSRAASSTSRVGRNAPCPCGSGKKYKKCCGV